MGGNNSKSNKKKQAKLNSSVSRLIKRLTQEGQLKKLKQSHLNEVFSGRPKLAQGLFKLSIVEGSCDIRKLTAVFEMMVEDQETRTLPHFRNEGTSPEAVLGMIFFGFKQEARLRDDITKEKAVEFFQFLIELVSKDKEENCHYFDQQINEILENQSSSMSYFDWISTLGRKLDALPRLINRIIHQIVEEPSKVLLPKKLEDVKNSLLTKPILSMLMGTNSKITEAEELQLVFSSSKSGSSFNRLAFALHGYEDPTIIIFQHQYSMTNGDKHQGIIGAYVPGGWRDELGFFGTPECFLFTVKPKLKILYSFRGKGGDNYVYMNSKKIKGSKYKTGLGFGGENFINWRLWLDDEIMTESTVSPTDRTYPVGALHEGYEEKLRITRIEVWGLGTEETLKKRDYFRGLETQRVSNARKVDKNAVLGDEFARENLLGKTFSHRQNMVLDIGIIKEEQKHKKEN